MNLQYFPHFIRANYKNFANDITNEQMIELGQMFKKYLEERFKNKMDKLDDIWNIDPINIITNIDNPLRTNGYNSALILHFHNFCKEELARD